MILPGRGTTGAKSASAAGTGAAPSRGRPSPPAASTSPTSAASSGTSTSPSSRAAVVPPRVLIVASRIAPSLACRGGGLPRPVILRGLGRGERLRRAEAGGHRGGRPGQDLVMLDVQQPQPALLAHGQGDEAAELDQFRLGEVLVQPLPQRVVGVQPPRDRLRVGQRRLLAFGEPGRGLEVEQVVVLSLAQAL